MAYPKPTVSYHRTMAELKDISDFTMDQHIVAQLTISLEFASVQLRRYKQEVIRLEGICSFANTGSGVHVPADLLLLHFRANSHVRSLGLEVSDLENEISILKEKVRIQWLKHPSFFSEPDDEDDPQPSHRPPWCEQVLEDCDDDKHGIKDEKDGEDEPGPMPQTNHSMPCCGIVLEPSPKHGSTSPQPSPMPFISPSFQYEDNNGDDHASVCEEEHLSPL